jgi:hypothetical protein
MPDHFYTGHAGTYPHHRDARDLPIGYVEPGDIRDLDLDEPLDHHWVPVSEGEDLLALLLAQREAGRAGAGGDPGGEDSEEAAGQQRGRSRRPRPDESTVPPPLTPPDTTTDAGAAGSEENAE